jgi:hypothetical protein
MSAIRIVAILLSIAGAASLGYGLGMPWHISVPLGVLTCLVVRHIGGAVIERKRFMGRIDQFVKKAKFGEPLG